MKIERFAAVGLTLALIASAFISSTATSAQTSSPVPVSEPEAAVQSFHAALATGDREQALAWLDPEVVIFESGGAEQSREEYASHHLAADIEFSRAVKSDVVDRQSHTAGNLAWVLTRTRATGRFRERDVNAQGVETMVLRRGDGQWRILHIHWSSRPEAVR